MLEDEEGGEASPLPELHLQFPRRGAVTSQGASGNWNSLFFYAVLPLHDYKTEPDPELLYRSTNTALPQGMS